HQRRRPWRPGLTARSVRTRSAARRGQTHVRRSERLPGLGNGPPTSALIDRQGAVVQLQDRQAARRGVDGTDAAQVPTSVAGLPGGDVFEDYVPVFAP